MWRCLQTHLQGAETKPFGAMTWGGGRGAHGREQSQLTESLFSPPVSNPLHHFPSLTNMDILHRGRDFRLLWKTRMVQRRQALTPTRQQWQVWTRGSRPGPHFPATSLPPPCHLPAVTSSLPYVHSQAWSALHLALGPVGCREVDKLLT